MQKTVLVFTCGDKIGDGLYKLPFLQRLRARFPDAHIVWLAGIGPTVYARELSPLVGTYLDEVIELPDFTRGPRDLLAPPPPLAGRTFDIVIDTQRSVFRTLVLRRLRSRLFVSGTAGFLFSGRRPARRAARPAALKDYLTQLLDLASPFEHEAGATEGSALAFAVPPAFAEAAQRLLPDGPVYVGLSPGAGDRSKMWPLEKFLRVAEAQAAAGRVPVVFLGPDERAWIEEIKARLPFARLPEHEPDTRPPEVAGPIFVVALARRLAAAVANDSGSGHMFAAAGTPLVSLFSKHDPAKYAPNVRQLQIVDSKTYGGTDPGLIPLETVLDALERILSGESRSAVPHEGASFPA